MFLFRRKIKDILRATKYVISDVFVTPGTYPNLLV